MSVDVSICRSSCIIGMRKKSRPFFRNLLLPVAPACGAAGEGGVALLRGFPHLFVEYLAVMGYDRSLDYLVVKINIQVLLVRREERKEVVDVPRVELACVNRDGAGKVHRADNGHIMAYHVFSGLGKHAVSALLHDEIDDNGAGLHLLDHLLGYKRRGRSPRDKGGRDDDIRVFRMLADYLLLLFVKIRRHLHRIAARVLGLVVIDVQGDEFPAEASYLLARRGPRIEARNYRSEPFSRGDSLKTRHPRAYDYGLCRVDRPCGS